MTLQSFIAQNRIKMTTKWADSNPNMTADDWSRGASHWKCQIRAGRRAMTTFFSQGSAHIGEPTLTSVLDCLASDAAGFENAQSFEDWASEYGYDADSRKAEKTFKAISKQAEGLKRLLGEDAYGTLLWHTDRE